MKPDVFIKRQGQPDYSIDKLQPILKNGLDTVFGPEYFKEGQRILLKPNFLIEAAPGEAITTHPKMIIAIAKILKETGCKIFVADNPSGLGSYKSIEKIYKQAGLTDYSELFTLLYNNRPPLKKAGFSLSWWTEGFDKIINLPKLKTHDLMGITAGIKNLFGFIPGLTKSQIHKSNPRPEDMAGVILDLYDQIRPQINILDGIISLEGQGPAKKGTPKERGLIMISNSALKMDFILSQIIGLEPKNIPHLRLSLEKKLLNPANITTYPKDISSLTIEDFIMNPAQHITEKIPKSLLKLVTPLINFKLYVKDNICIRCKRCIQICPQKAITSKEDGKIEIDKEKCILCMCCREVCPTGCIEIRKNFLFEILKKIF